jgi:immune inhibitor A
MQRYLRLLGALVAGALIAVPTALAGSDNGSNSDYVPSTFSVKQDQLRQQALAMQAKGLIPADSKVGKVAKGQYVQLAREGEDSIFTILVEFGTATNTTHTHAGDKTHAPVAGDTAPAPLHNQIPKPDRSVDNSTIWTSNFDQTHYNNLLFADNAGAVSMRNFYKEQSSNRYTVNGDVSDWIKVPYNEPSYGSNYCGSIVCADTYRLIQDGANAWYAKQIANGMTPDQINTYLSKFDKWDRYDANGNGNFNEPDGFIDHFQMIHAGEGEEVGGGQQGTDAIWSHRSYAARQAGGPNGFPGVHIGNSNYWIGDYTIEPENGGAGVFSHEFAHDLGLPDEYDTSGNTGGAENSTGFWTLMSSGSYGNDGTEDIGSKPLPMNAWDKFELGWLNYEVARPGEKTSEHKLGPAEYNTKQAQGLITVLPDRKVTSNVGTPKTGSWMYYSTTGDALNVSMSKSFAVPTGNTTLTADINYSTEPDFDYAFLEVSTDNGATFKPVATSVSTATDPNGNNPSLTGIQGSSGGWVPLTANLGAATAGKTVVIRWRYATDANTHGAGIQLDNISVGGAAADGAETDTGWTFDGWKRSTGQEVNSYFNAYFAENRTYSGYDASLAVGPYNFGFLDNPQLQNFVERHPYEDGLLVWYFNSQYTDNNVGDHPGEGEILPVDSHPAMLHWSDGSLVRPRIAAYDATFGLDPTDAITLHRNSVPTTFASQAAVPVFNDLNSYWVASDPADARYKASWYSVNNPHTGTQIQVKSLTPGGFMQVSVTPPAAG